jgi:hypothetical protein
VSRGATPDRGAITCKEGDVEINSDNWYEHVNENGFQFLAFQPTSTNVYGNQDMVILTFADDEAGAGVQLALTHRSFREFLTAVAKARETFEAKQEEFGGEEEE